MLSFKGSVGEWERRAKTERREGRKASRRGDWGISSSHGKKRPWNVDRITRLMRLGEGLTDIT